MSVPSKLGVGPGPALILKAVARWLQKASEPQKHDWLMPVACEMLMSLTPCGGPLETTGSRGNVQPLYHAARTLAQVEGGQHLIMKPNVLAREG